MTVISEYVESLESAQATRRQRRDLLAKRLASRTGSPGYESNCAELREKLDNLDLVIARSDSEISRVRGGGKIEFDL